MLFCICVFSQPWKEMFEFGYLGIILLLHIFLIVGDGKKDFSILYHQN